MSAEGSRDEMRPECDFRGATRGVHHLRYKERTNLRLLAPDLASQFRDDDAVNGALREYLRLKQESA